MADPLSKPERSTRDPWTDDGADPSHIDLCYIYILKFLKKIHLPVYECKPAGLLLGRNALTVLELRCKVAGDGERPVVSMVVAALDSPADVDGRGSSVAVESFRSP